MSYRIWDPDRYVVDHTRDRSSKLWRYVYGDETDFTGGKSDEWINGPIEDIQIETNIQIKDVDLILKGLPFLK